MHKNEFWRTLFEAEKLATKLKDAANAKDDGIAVQTQEYGKIQVKAKSATESGENFLSDAYIVRAILLESGDEHQAFVKVLPSAPMLFQGATTQGVYHRELAAYKTLHPMLRELRDRANVGQDEVPLAVCAMHHGHIDEHGPLRANSTAFVLEDLGLEGYKMTDKKVGVNAEEAFATLTALANYHALSIALVRQWRNSEGRIELPDSLKFLETNVAFQDLVFQMIGAVMPTYVEMFKKLEREKDAEWLDDDFNNNAEKALTPEPLAEAEPIICVLHSDCWNNNLLYRYGNDAERPLGVRIIDWQIIRLGHPVFDFLQFLYSSTSAELRAEHMPEFLDRYYNTLESALILLQCPIFEEHGYTRARFMEDVQKRMRFALYYSFIMLPAMNDTAFADVVEKGKNEDFAEGQDLPEMFDAEKYKDISSSDKILANKVLCEALVSTFNEVKSCIETCNVFVS